MIGRKHITLNMVDVLLPYELIIFSWMWQHLIRGAVGLELLT